MQGYNATVLAYGQTGSGKTLTMSGGTGIHGIPENGGAAAAAAATPAAGGARTGAAAAAAAEAAMAFGSRQALSLCHTAAGLSAASDTATWHGASCNIDSVAARRADAAGVLTLWPDSCLLFVCVCVHQCCLSCCCGVLC